MFAETFGRVTRYIPKRYTDFMERHLILGQLMRELGISQTELSGISGVKQPNISRYLSGRKPLGESVFDHLLSCMGFESRVRIEVVQPELTRSERRSWLLHRHVSSVLSDDRIESELPRLKRNLDRVRERSQGEPHESNIREWNDIFRDRDWLRLRRVLTGLDRHSIEMREVSPMSGLLSDSERRDVLKSAA